MRRVVCLLAALALPGCMAERGGGESEPAERAEGLVIQGPSSIPQGSTDRLHAAVGGASVGDKVVWWSIPKRVISVDSGGVVTAGALGAGVVIAELGDHRAYHVVTVDPNSRPVRNQVAGIWSGDYRITACERLSGSGPSTCRSILESRFPFQLSITKGGNALEGQLRLGGLSGQVLGVRDFTGKSLVEGTLLPIQPQEHLGPVGRAELTRWDVKFAVPQKRLRGDLEYLETFSNNWGHQVYLVAAELMNVIKK